MSPRRKDEASADPAAEIAVLTIERERLRGEHLFRESALANLEAVVGEARRQVDEVFPAMLFVDSPQAALMGNPDLARLFVVASDAWRDQQLKRIAGDPRPGHPGVQWSVLTRAETQERIGVIDERLQVLQVELRKQETRERIAAEQAELERLERGELPAEEQLTDVGKLEPVAPTATAVGDDDEDDDLVHKGP